MTRSTAPRPRARRRCTPRFDALRGRIDYQPETLAWNVADGRLHVVRGTESRSLPFDALIIAAGATDRLMPVRAGTWPACTAWARRRSR
ncbi:MAG: hypothetical protein U1E53_23695 [Dongiaceae bacterium]